MLTARKILFEIIGKKEQIVGYEIKRDHPCFCLSCYLFSALAHIFCVFALRGQFVFLKKKFDASDSSS